MGAIGVTRPVHALVALAGVLAALALAAPQAAHATLEGTPCSPPKSPPEGPVVKSDNVDFVGTIPNEAGSLLAGGRVVGHYFYATGSDHFSIYDVADPVHPKFMSRVDFPCRFENEDVAVNGKVLIYTDFATTDTLSVYDVRDKSNPKLISELQGAGTHTMACLYDCQFLYGTYHAATTAGALRTGEVVDLRDPAAPVVLGDWTENEVLPSRDVHATSEVKPGFVLTASAPIEYLDVRPGTPESLVHPKVLARSETGTDHSERWHTTIWPRAGDDRFILGTLETNGTPNCRLGVGAFSTFDTTGWEKTGAFKKVDSYFLSDGLYFDGNPPANVLGCSPHWFNVRPSWKDGGVVALGAYDNGIRFLNVDAAGKIKEIGYAVPPGTETSGAYWVDCDTVYTADYTRGIDIYRLKDPGSGCSKDNPGGPGQAGRCVDRRKFSFRLHHARGARVVKVKVYVNGKLKLTRRGHDIKRVTVKRLPKKRFKVKIVATHSTGSKLVSTRTYRGCKKGRPRTRSIRHGSTR